MGVNNGDSIYNGSDFPNDFSGMSGAVELPLKVFSGKLTNGGSNLNASGQNAWAEGVFAESSGYATHAEGDSVQSTGHASHAEGRSTESSGYATHAEGMFSKALATGAHAEGSSTEATEQNAHAEGYSTKATGQNAHAEGNYSKATGNHSHAEGSACEANGVRAHAGGNTCIANGSDSFTHGSYLKTTSDKCVVVGEYNLDEAAYLVVGSGTADDARKNVFKIDKSGNLWFMHNGVLTNLSTLLNLHNIT